MEWTRERPTEGGYYGYFPDSKGRGNRAGTKVTVLAVVEKRGIPCAVYGSGNLKPTAFMDGWWCGPVTFPPVPEESMKV